MNNRQTEVRLRNRFGLTDTNDTSNTTDAGIADHLKGWSLWARALGNKSERDTDGDYLGYDQDTTGIAVGLDGKPNSWLLTGLGLGYTDSDLDWNNTNHKGALQGKHIGIYASTDINNYYVDGYAGYAGFDNSGSRDISFYGYSALTAGDFDSNAWLGRVEGGYDFPVKNWLLTPVAAAGYTHLKQDSFTESGAGHLNLDIDEITTESLSTALGVRASGLYAVGQWQLVPRAKVIWLHEFKDDAPTVDANFADYSVSQFSVIGVAPVSNLGVMELGLIAEYGKNLSLYIDYNSALADGFNSHLLSAGMAWKF